MLLSPPVLVKHKGGVALSISIIRHLPPISSVSDTMRRISHTVPPFGLAFAHIRRLFKLGQIRLYRLQLLPLEQAPA